MEESRLGIIGPTNSSKSLEHGSISLAGGRVAIPQASDFILRHKSHIERLETGDVFL